MDIKKKKKNLPPLRLGIRPRITGKFQIFLNSETMSKYSPKFDSWACKRVGGTEMHILLCRLEFFRGNRSPNIMHIYTNVALRFMKPLRVSSSSKKLQTIAGCVYCGRYFIQKQLLTIMIGKI